MPPSQRCDNCIYFSLADGKDHGICRRFPPDPHYTEQIYGSFPIVRIDSWCGEYKKT